MELHFVPQVFIQRTCHERATKRTRASKPKVRSGCLTCKKRHVKCDEKKPHCLRCEVGYYRCDGYGEQPDPNEKDKNATESTSQEASRRLPLILPKPSNNRKRDASIGGDAHLVVSRFPYVQLFDERDASYFDLFRTHIVRDLSGYAYSDFWSRTVLRESMDDECIRHCVLGIGALSRSLEFGMHSMDQSAIMEAEAHEVTLHREAALRHYGKALCLYRQRMVSWGDRLPTARILPVTLLCMVFEFLQGHISAVDNLITSSIKLLQNKLRILQAPSPPGLEIDEAEELLARLSALSAITPFFPSSQENYGILNAKPLNMVPDHKSDMNVITVMWKSSYTRLCIFGSRCQGATLRDPRFHPDDAKEEQEAHLTNLQEWKAVLTSRMEIEEHADHRRTLLLMVIQCYIGSLFVQGCMDTQGGLTYDRFTDDFRKVIALFKVFLADTGPKPKISFTFEIGILPSICMVIHTCRDQQLRREATGILSSLVQQWGDFREGPWDSRILAKGFRTIVSLEEAGMDETGFIPPSARYRWTGTVYNVYNGQLIAEYTKLFPNEGEERVRLVPLHLQV